MNYPKYEVYKDSGVEWLGEMPNDWNVVKLKHVLSIHNGSDYKHIEINEDKGGFPVYGSGGIFAYVSKFIYDKESILLGRKGTIDKPLHVNEPFWTVDTMFYTKIKNNICGKFIYYQAINFPFQYFSTSTALPSMTQFDLLNMSIILPSYDEQVLINNFLDQKTAQIDQAIAIKEQQIALLNERKQIVIQQAVTKGLDPNVKMKDSGVEWIGEIPEHWSILANKYIFKIKKDLVGKKSSEYELLSLTLNGVIKRDMDNPEGKFPAEFDTYQKVHIDDFIFCHFDVEETPRTVGLSKFNGMITGAYTVYKVDKKFFDLDFLYYFYLNLDINKRLRPLYKGLRNTIGKDVFSSFKTFAPPLIEQKSIVEFITQKMDHINLAITLKKSEMQKLKEYKTTLINDAVTGKIKVA